VRAPTDPASRLRKQAGASIRLRLRFPIAELKTEQKKHHRADPPWRNAASVFART
jgi:hypothetical protein